MSDKPLTPGAEIMLLMLQAAKKCNYRGGKLTVTELFHLWSVSAPWSVEDISALKEIVETCPEKIFVGLENLDKH